MTTRDRCLIAACVCAASSTLAQRADHKLPAQRIASCAPAVLAGQVQAGESFERVFQPGLVFKLEAIRSGWIVRVFPSGVPRAPHDFTEVATPPYQSVTPLAVSTDFSFRAQDAVGWNPRHFRYAPDAGRFTQLAREYDAVMAGDAAATARVSTLIAALPEAQLTILDAHLVPGSNDQVGMAAAVASHFASTPHEVDQSAAREPLGRITALSFRVTFDRAAGSNCPAAHEKPVARR